MEPPASSGREAGPPGPSSRRLLLQIDSGGPSLSVRLSNSSFLSNTAAGGGGGYSLTLRNGAGQGGGVVATGSRLLAVSSCNFTSNAALAADGGGLQVLAPDSGVLLEPSYMLDISGALLASNRAASGGGGLSLSGPLAVTLEDTVVLGNVAAGGAGGGVAARGCLALSLIHSNVSDNNAPAGSGGGVFAGGRARVYMREATLEGNRALAGGGVHLSSEEGHPGDAVGGAVDGAGTAAVLAQTRVYGNAASQELGLASGAAAGVQGRGGGLYVSGAVGVVIVGGDFSGGNQGRIGSTIATTQTCMPQQLRSPEDSAPSRPPPGAPTSELLEVSVQSRTFSSGQRSSSTFMALYVRSVRVACAPRLHTTRHTLHATRARGSRFTSGRSWSCVHGTIVCRLVTRPLGVQAMPNASSTIPDALAGPWLAALEGVMRRSSCYPLALLGATRLPRSGSGSGASLIEQVRCLVLATATGTGGLTSLVLLRVRIRSLVLATTVSSLTSLVTRKCAPPECAYQDPLSPSGCVARHQSSHSGYDDCH